MKIASNAPVLEPRKKFELPALEKNETKELSRNYYSIVDDKNKDLRQDLGMAFLIIEILEKNKF